VGSDEGVRGSTREGELPSVNHLLHFGRIRRNINPIPVLGVKETSELLLVLRRPDIQRLFRIWIRLFCFLVCQTLTLVVVVVLFQQVFGKVLKFSLWMENWFVTGVCSH
jgi:hypothetical protein